MYTEYDIAFTQHGPGTVTYACERTVANRHANVGVLTLHARTVHTPSTPAIIQIINYKVKFIVEAMGNEGFEKKDLKRLKDAVNEKMHIAQLKTTQSIPNGVYLDNIYILPDDAKYDIYGDNVIKKSDKTKATKNILESEDVLKKSCFLVLVIHRINDIDKIVFFCRILLRQWKDLYKVDKLNVPKRMLPGWVSYMQTPENINPFGVLSSGEVVAQFLDEYKIQFNSYIKIDNSKIRHIRNREGTPVMLTTVDSIQIGQRDALEYFAKN